MSVLKIRILVKITRNAGRTYHAIRVETFSSDSVVVITSKSPCSVKVLENEK